MHAFITRALRPPVSTLINGPPPAHSLQGYLCSNAPGASGEGSDARLVVDLLRPWLQRRAARQERHRGGNGSGGSRGGGRPAERPPRLFTVGRLDVQSVGLIFVSGVPPRVPGGDSGHAC